MNKEGEKERKEEAEGERLKRERGEEDVRRRENKETQKKREREREGGRGDRNGLTHEIPNSDRIAISDTVQTDGSVISHSPTPGQRTHHSTAPASSRHRGVTSIRGCRTECLGSV